MLRAIWVLLLALLGGSVGWAQDTSDDILQRLSSRGEEAGVVTMRLPQHLADAMRSQRAENAKMPGLEGYRVRIYRGLGKSARAESERIVARVMEKWPGMPTYRSFSSPYYKVTVGDCRTHIEAHALRRRFSAAYPQSFVVGERINFPAAFPRDSAPPPDAQP